jgi:hypothetical protein
VLLIRRIFTNKDGSTGCLNLVCSDLRCDGEQAATLYQKRWNGEVFHKSLKSNAALGKSPTATTQANHVFMTIFAVFKLECLNTAQNEPFRLARKTADQGYSTGLSTTTSAACCVTSVSNL